MKSRIIVFTILCVSALWIALDSLLGLYAASIYKDYYSHIILIPLISAYFIYDGRKEIFSENKSSYNAGIAVMILASLLFFAGRTITNVDQNDLTSITVFSAVIFMNGAFIAAFGMKAYKAALFPLLFLIFAAPIPSAVMDFIITSLQVGSTELTELLFIITGTPYLRDGFVFHLPGISIEVAKQCSGIRSTLALFITAILAGYMFLRTPWKIVLLVLLTIPVAMFKNAVRITTLTIMSIHIDPRIIQSSLHREGGIPFFVMGLLLLAPVLFFLRKSELKMRKTEIPKD